MGFCYSPILKTTDAELKALRHLGLEVLESALPILELTRSRRSKNNPEGSIAKRIDQIQDILGKHPFILDVTTEPAMSNAQIDSILFGGADGFRSWIRQVRDMRDQGLLVIPMIHYDPVHEVGVGRQIKRLLKLSPVLAFRVDPHDDDLDHYLRFFAQHMNISDLILVLDGRYLSLSNNPDGDYADYFHGKVTHIQSSHAPKGIVCAFSSFPDSVTRKHYGDDESGTFPVAELVTNRNLQSVGVVAGDYGSVHPLRYSTGGGTWIPRIDFVGDDDQFHYHRYRREDGGYVRAAGKVVDDEHYQAIAGPFTWGDTEIELAAGGEPSGKSPSHWIAVRVSLYITQMTLKFREGNQISL